jgi:Predicted membrane protein
MSMNRQMLRGDLGWALRYGLTALLGFFFGIVMGQRLHAPSAPIGALWCAIAGLAALQSTADETWKATRGQLLGTFVGAVIAALYLSLQPFSPWGLAACVGATVFACRRWRFADNGRQAAVNVAVIMVISSLHPDLNAFANSALRFTEACVGTAIALALAHLPRLLARWRARRRPPHHEAG